MVARSRSSERSTAARAHKPRQPAKPKQKRYGCERPRIWTKPLRRLTPKTTLGYEVIEFAEAVLCVALMPWQKWLLIHALELRPDGSFRFRNVVVLVARQNGKSTVSVVLALYFMYVLGVKLVLGTAQDLDTAEEVWEKAVEFVTELDDDDNPVRPELYEMLDRVVQVNGKKCLILTTRERYKVKASSRRAGRGLSGDLILLDELREHQSWDAWGAVTKTTMARPNAQVWSLSNAGDVASVVLRYLRLMAHAALGDPDGIVGDEDPTLLARKAAEDDDAYDDDDLEIDDDTLGIFEWSAPPGCDRRDRDGWAQANPALGYHISERTVASACATDPEWVFRTECLCQWNDGSAEGPFPPDTWEGGMEDGSKVAAGERKVVCVDVSWDRSTTHVAIAGLRDDGLPHVGIIATRIGTDWVIPWLQGDQAPDFDSVLAQTNGAPVSSLVEDMREAGLPTVDWSGSDLPKACGAFYDAVAIVKDHPPTDDEPGKGVRHRPQPVLDLAAGTAVARPTGDGYVWDRKRSPQDASPLMAVTGALWGLTRPAPKKKPPPDIF